MPGYRPARSGTSHVQQPTHNMLTFTNYDHSFWFQYFFQSTCITSIYFLCHFLLGPINTASADSYRVKRTFIKNSTVFSFLES